MAALTADRNTRCKMVQRKVKLPVAAATKIYAGSMVSVNAAGYAVPSSDTAGHVFFGRAAEQVDNSAGANGDKEIEVERGVFKWNNSGLTQAEVGDTVHVSDDNTVTTAGTAVNDVAVGRLEEVESDGVWVSSL